jgi:hypothetical protein
MASLGTDPCVAVLEEKPDLGAVLARLAAGMQRGITG